MAMRSALEIARFCGFTLDLRRRVLHRAGAPVALHARAFDLLAFLIEHRERAVSQAEILAQVWNNRIVAENNLSVQLSSLRKALVDAGCAETLIVTHPGRRYQFVGTMEVEAASAEAAALPEAQAAAVVPPAMLAAAPAFVLAPAVLPAPGRRRRPVLWSVTAAIAAGLAAGWIFWPAPTGASRLSIAVLPFRNASDDRSQDYLADAISDDLTADLAHIPAATVIARASAEAVRAKPPQEIGAALHVRYIVTGTVALEGDAYHVVATLTDAATARQLWSAQFDPQRERLAGLRQEIVQRIARPLHVTLDALENARSLHDRADDPTAIDLFFQARSVLDSAASLDRFEAAQALLDRALRAQPEFVDARAALAWALLLKVTLTDDPDDAADFARAKASISQVLSVSPQNSEALSARAKLRQIEGDCTGARGDAEAVLAMEPSNVNVRSVLGGCDQADFRLDEAAADYESMVRLDPANPNAHLRYITLGTIRLVQGRYKDAVALLRRGADREAAPSTDLEPAEQAQLMLMAAIDLAGDQDRARALYSIYAGRFRNRTVWRISAFFRPSWRRSDGLWRALAGLRDAGMPMYAGDTDAVIADGAACLPGDFSSTPLHLPDGGRVLDTAGFLAVLGGRPAPLVLDVGRGFDAPPDWVVYAKAGSAENAPEFALHVARQRRAASAGSAVIVLGEGVSGCLPYWVAEHLMETGLARVMWYRGGEEAWRAHAEAVATSGNGAGVKADAR